MDYRSFYKSQTFKDIPDCFDVHHINFNRDCNDIENLVAIPKLLHIEYHKSYGNVPIDFLIGSEILKPKCLFESPGELTFLLYSLNEYQKTKLIVEKWISYRDHLRGITGLMYQEKY